MTTLHKKILSVFVALLVLFSLLFATGYRASVTAFAEATKYSSVLEDLKKDKSFNVEDYPAKGRDTSISLIQIAESNNGELFIYVYQPSAIAYGMQLTTIRMSTSYDGDVWADYDLTRLDSSGTLAKYKVENFTVSEKSTRYYNITALHRKYNKLMDGGTVTGNHDSEVAVEVAQCWTVVTVGNTVTYSMEYADVVEISKPVFGTVRYKDGQGWLHSYAIDAHFIAFSVTNWSVDQLLEADVAFKEATKKSGVWTNSTGEATPNKVTVSYMEYGGTTGAHSFNSKKRTWDRIQTGANFAATCETLNDDVKAEVRKYDWVLCYYETPYENYTGGTFGFVNTVGSFFGANNTSTCTIVSDVTILRLKFVSDGETYNLGVVSNKSGTSEIKGDDSSSFWSDVKNTVWDKIKSWFRSVPWWAWIIIGVVAIVVALFLLCHFVPSAAHIVLSILKGIGKFLLSALNGLCWLIAAPFRGIAALIRRRKERKDK